MDKELTLHTVSTKALLRALTPSVRQLDERRGKKPWVQGRIIGHLRLCQTASWGELIEAVYGDDPQGGPLLAHASLYAAAWELQKDGWPIRVRKAQGLWLAE